MTFTLDLLLFVKFAW